jgi:hypothetical protein
MKRIINAEKNFERNKNEKQKINYIQNLSYNFSEWFIRFLFIADHYIFAITKITGLQLLTH